MGLIPIQRAVATELGIDSDSTDKVSESGFCSQCSTELIRILESGRPFDLRLFSAKGSYTLDSLSDSSYYGDPARVAYEAPQT